MIIDPSNPQPQIMRTPQELQRAHDLLVGMIISDELRRRVFGPDDEKAVQERLMECANVLCWCLGHTHNVTFATNLQTIETAMERLGIPIFDSGSLHEGGWEQ